MGRTENTVFASRLKTAVFRCSCFATEGKPSHPRETERHGPQAKVLPCDRRPRKFLRLRHPKMAICNELEALLASKSVRKMPQIEWVRSCRPAMTTYQVLYYWCPVPRLDSPGPCLSAVFALFFTLFLLVARKQLFFAVLLGPLAVLPI